jgi:hypothetical protein
MRAFGAREAGNGNAILSVAEIPAFARMTLC